MKIRRTTSQQTTRTKRTSKEQPSNACGTRTEHRPLTVRYMKVLTVKETAAVLKVKPQWVYRMIRSDGLPCIRLGRQVRVDEDALDRWLTDRRSGG